MRATTSRTTSRGRVRRALAAVALLTAALAPVLASGSSAQAAPDDRATLFFIRTSGTPSGKIEIHTATAASHYQQADLHTTTYFRTAEARQGYFQMIGRTLWFLKVCETGSGVWELHSATPQSGYTSGEHIALGGAGFTNRADLTCDQQKARLARSWVHIALLEGGDTLAYPSAGFVLQSQGQLLVELQSSYPSGIPLTTRVGTVADPGTGATLGVAATPGGDAMPYSLQGSSTTGHLQLGTYRGTYQSDEVFGSFGQVSTRSTVFTARDAAAGVTDVRDVTGDGVPDVTYVKLVAPATGHVEVFYAPGTSPGTLGLASSTWFSPALATSGIWQLGSAAG